MTLRVFPPNSVILRLPNQPSTSAQSVAWWFPSGALHANHFNQRLRRA